MIFSCSDTIVSTGAACGAELNRRVCVSGLPLAATSGCSIQNLFLSKGYVGNATRRRCSPSYTFVQFTSAPFNHSLPSACISDEPLPRVMLDTTECFPDGLICCLISPLNV